MSPNEFQTEPKIGGQSHCTRQCNDGRMLLCEVDNFCITPSKPKSLSCTKIDIDKGSRISPKSLHTSTNNNTPIIRELNDQPRITLRMFSCVLPSKVSFTWKLSHICLSAPRKKF